MWVADPSADELSQSRLMGGATAPRRSLFVDPYDPNQEVGWLDSLWASAQRENTMTSYAGSQSFDTEASNADINSGVMDGFNPYQYLMDTYQESDLTDIMPYILDGELEETFSPRQVEAIMADLRRELELQRQASQHPGAAFVGGIVAALGDPTSFIPYVGQAGRLTRLGRAGTVSADAALSTTVSELALQASQRTRTLEETLLNIGTAGVIGGGIGMFAGANYRSNTLHPDNPNNPLRSDNLRPQPMIVRDAEGRMDELTSEEIQQLREDVDSINAARVGGPNTHITGRDTELLRSENPGRVGQVTRALGEVFNSQTILGRTMRASSAEARRLGLSLMDTGGMLIRGFADGKAVSPPAEVIKDYYMALIEPLSSSMRQSVNELRISLGQKVNEEDVYRLTQRVLLNMDDAALARELTQRYGQNGFDRIMETAQKNADDIHNVNADFEQRMIERGILQDEAIVTRLTSELEAAKAEVERLKAEDVVDEAALTRARAIRDDRKAQLFTETSKAAPMGRDYGHAQVWNRDAVIENPHEFRVFLRDALLDRPTADWLSEPPYELTPQQFQELRVTDRQRYDEILEDWAGSAFYHRLDQAEQAHKAAVEADRQSTLDLNDTLREVGVLRRTDGQLSLSQARKVRDQINTNLEAARQSKARAEADLRTYRQGLATSERMARTPLDVRQMSKRQVRQQGSDTGRLDELMKQVQRETRRMETLVARRDRVQAALEKVEARRSEISTRRQALNDLLDNLRAQGRVTSKDLRSAKRELRNARKSTPLDELIEDVYANLTTRGSMPQGIMDRINEYSDKTTGRVKQRVINLNGDQRMAAIQHGWLRDDLPGVLYNQYDQISSELSLREALEIGPGQRFSSWEERIKAVESDYDDLIAAAPDRATRNRLTSERQVVVDDLNNVRERIRSRGMPDDGTTFGWANWLSAKLRNVQLVRFVGGFLPSSMTDIATMSLRTGSFGKALWNYGRQSARSAINLSRKDGVSMNMMETFVASNELGIGFAQHMRRFGSEDTIHGPNGSAGIGYGRTRQVTGAYDRGMNWMTEKAVLFSGLPLWNRTMKVMAGHMMAARLRDSLPNYSNLKPHEIADLASVGIGRSEAQRLARQIQKHGSTVEGRFDPGLENWNPEDARLFLMAIQRDMNRAVNTPGAGDTPRLMDQWWGKLWLQFQTFAFTFINRYAYPSVQRVAMGDRHAISTWVYLAGLSAMVVAMKDLLRGNDPTQRYSEGRHADTFYEILDRSGLMGWTSPYVDSALKMAGFGGLERYSRQRAFEGIAGVNYGFFNDAGRAAVSVLDGDPNMLDKLLVMAPLSTQARILQQLATE